MSKKPTVVWGCDDTSEGTLFNGVGDARVNGLASEMQTDAQTEACIESLEASRKRSRAEALAADSAAADAAASSSSHDDSTTPLSALMAPLRHFKLADAGSGAPGLKLYDAMLSPDASSSRPAILSPKARSWCSRRAARGRLRRRGAALEAGYRLVSILSTEAARKLAPDLAANGISRKPLCGPPRAARRPTGWLRQRPTRPPTTWRGVSLRAAGTRRARPGSSTGARPRDRAPPPGGISRPGCHRSPPRRGRCARRCWCWTASSTRTWGALPHGARLRRATCSFRRLRRLLPQVDPLVDGGVFKLPTCTRSAGPRSSTSSAPAATG